MTEENEGETDLNTHTRGIAINNQLTNTMFINYTPHDITWLNEATTKEVVIPKSGKIARVSTKTESVSNSAEFPIITESYVGFTDIPEPVEGTFFIVSAMVRTALPERKDLVSPTSFIRNQDGNIIGCKCFVKNS